MSVIDIENCSRDRRRRPCGEDLETTRLRRMEKLAQETPERQYGDTIIPVEPPDWRGVRKLALTAWGRTRDLRCGVSDPRSAARRWPAGFADGWRWWTV